ncbi:hypothetical protein MTO96_032052 [Rhipicephalus appendiculatus]
MVQAVRPLPNSDLTTRFCSGSLPPWLQGVFRRQGKAAQVAGNAEPPTSLVQRVNWCRDQDRLTDLLHQGRRHLAVSAWKPLLEPSLDFPWRHRKERPRPAFGADTQAQSSGKESAAERSGSWGIDKKWRRYYDGEGPRTAGKDTVDRLSEFSAPKFGEFRQASPTDASPSVKHHRQTARQASPSGKRHRQMAAAHEFR